MKLWSRTVASLLLSAILLTGCVHPKSPSADSDEPRESVGTETAINPDGTSIETGTEADTMFHPDPEDSDIPVLSVNTADQKPITSKTTYKSATITVTGAKYAHYNITMNARIRGRGHSSFDGNAAQNEYASKNSYRLKLDEKTNLLGVGETADRDWILISCKYDASALRNYLIWNLAERLGTIPYVPSCTWVNLYVNGEYRGMYTLCEKIEVASDRVNIDESPSEDPNKVGYLVEYDLRGAYESGAKKDLTYFYLPGLDESFAWTIKSEVHNSKVTAAIREHLIACNEAILSGDQEKMAALVDMAAFVDMFILQELSKNPDAGCSSFYMQRDAGGKLCLTAPWDFDFAMGTYSIAQTTSGLVADGEDVMSHPWFEFLTTQPWFMKLVLAHMKGIAPLVEETLKAVKDMQATLESAADQNDTLWNVYGEKFSIYPSNQVSVKLKSYEEHVDFLINWVETRWERMLKEVEKRTK
ncbi:MAG: CotH kinase family protein [Clostridia bacterium]|nr:CotH kinase family protein [Clostridia bacterium]